MNADTAPLAWTTAIWWALLRDQEALLRRPGTHHKLLSEGAQELLKAEQINSAELCDFLELADAALAYAIEALHDNDGTESEEL
ncbi:hypothetical protein [Pseudomonas sp. S3_H06]